MDLPLGLIPERDPQSHKGDHGRVLCVAGSRDMSGAAALCALGALRGGAGLVTLAVAESLRPIMAVKLTECLFHGLPQTPDESIDASAADAILKLMESQNVLAIGPGLSQAPETQQLVRTVLAKTDKPVVADADALNALAGRGEILEARSAATVITPHPGEMGRLTGLSAGAINADREGIARDFAARHGCIVVLKGYRTLVADSHHRLYENLTGNPGMATGGCGDVLTGLIAGLMGQGLSPFDAACVGVYVHGLAADIVAENSGQIGLIAGDIPDTIPTAIRRYQDLSAP